MKVRLLLFKLSRALLWWSIEPPLRDNLKIAFRAIDAAMASAVSAGGSSLSALAVLEHGVKVAKNTGETPEPLEVAQLAALFDVIKFAAKAAPKS